MNFSVYSGGRKIGDRLMLKRLHSEEIGIFESLRVYRGRIFREAEHLERLHASAQTAGFPELPEPARLRDELRTALKAYIKERGPMIKRRDLFLRLTLWEGNLFVLIGERSHPAALYKKGIALKTTVVRRSPAHAWPGEVKTNACQNAVLAGLETRPAGIHEWLFLDRDGLVTEVRAGNLFLVLRTGKEKKPLLATPPVLGILNGVTRLFVIECALQIGIPVRETPLTRHDFFNAAEAFLTNTSWEILPVRELDGRRIGGRIPGPVTLNLIAHFKQKAAEECRS